MTRFGAALAAALAAGLWLGGGAAHAQEPGTVEITSVDAAAYPTVTAVVTAPPGLGGVGYRPEAFELLEDGSPVKPTVERTPAGGLEVVMVFDTSGSMEGAPLAAAQGAGHAFLGALPPEVRVGIVAFGPTPTTVAAPTTDRAYLAAQVDGLTAAGETALYDAVVHATSQFTPEAGDRAIVLLSDGGDTASGADLGQAATAAGTANVNVIELVTPESNRGALEQLAAAGGGGVSSATDPAALADLYRATAKALDNRYTITYRSAAHGAVELTARLTTDQGMQEHSVEVALPAAPAPADAAAPGGPAGEDAPAAAPAAGQADDGTTVSRLGLSVGAAAVFLALVLLGLVALPRDPRSRLSAARLGASHAVADAPSVSQVTRRMASAAEQFLERRGGRQSLATALEVAGISLRTGEYLVLVGAVTVVAALAGLALAGVVGMVGALVIVPLAAWVVVNRMADRRRARFAELLPDNLQLLTSTLRSGYGLLQGLDTLAREASEPAAGELRRVLLEVRVGRDPGAALHALAERMRSEDFAWVVAAIDINRDVGGDLAMILDNVAETIRERQRLFRQVKALTAEGRISGYVLTALPLFLAAAMTVINPGYIDALTSGVGLLLVAVGSGMLVVGWFWIQRLSRLAF